jgi:hypothetical protein
MQSSSDATEVTDEEAAKTDQDRVDEIMERGRCVCLCVCVCVRVCVCLVCLVCVRLLISIHKNAGGACVLYHRLLVVRCDLQFA